MWDKAGIGGVERQFGVRQPGVCDNLRMNQVGELPDAVGDPRSRSREVRITVHNHCPYRQAQLRGTLERLLEAEAAGRHDYQLRLLAEDGIPGGRERVFARLAEHV